ncbi:retinoic acid receptor responder protein 2-like [Rhinatrema bivittatum]|uniref:retinoic acid receptor responder protein 2-like n=1 Tax=Rhinatrema bivittatum TaxID=194408 RepID=UPI00112B92F1|nr:retinoic acid receptor responder protein 2-like [Rhinatrema bivittatum]
MLRKMKELLLALWLCTIALPGSDNWIQVNELIPHELKALETAVEDFNKNVNLHAFKILHIRLRNATVVYSGNDVRITFSMKQTNCHKHNFQADQCPHKRNGRVLHCIACFAFEDQTAEPLAQFMDCVPVRQPAQERLAQQQRKCEEVKQKIPVHHIGQYSFLKMNAFEQQ